nr:hypothetical protein [Anaerolineae bacterium]
MRSQLPRSIDSIKQFVPASIAVVLALLTLLSCSLFRPNLPSADMETLSPETPTPPAIPTAQATPTVTHTPAMPENPVDCLPDAAFIDDITIPDNTVLAPGETFTKTWRMENTGTCHWLDGYTLVFQSGSRMSGPESMPLPFMVEAGLAADISIDLVAPSEPGVYAGLWQLQAPDGTLFGTEPYVQIVVQELESEAGDQEDCVYSAAYVADVTIPDDTEMEPGESFTKTWRMQNSGTCAWGEDYALVFLRGSQMSDSGSVPVPYTAPGATVDISVLMTAPDDEGIYASVWRLQAPDGTQFGTEPYLRIVVKTPGSSISSSGCLLDASLVSDAMSPSSASLEPGDSFSVTWRLRNIGTCSWDVSYQVAQVSGARMGSQSVSPVPSAAPGSTVAITVNLTVPDAGGTLQSIWRLRAPDGAWFGPDLPVSVSGDGYVPGAAFIADVTIPDNSRIQPGSSFTKIWRVRNNGLYPWEAGTQLVFQQGDQLGTSAISVPATAPGAVVDISLTMTAPSAPGFYVGVWKLRSPAGTIFGEALTTTIQVPGFTRYQDMPYISGISGHARAIFHAGQQRGNRASVFSKVGDSITSSWDFMIAVGDGYYQLGSYEYLRPAIEYFIAATARTSNSFNNRSLAAYGGWTSADLLDPAKADPLCSGYAPLECELRMVKPAVALIMIGTNDPIDYVDFGAYERNLRQIIGLTLRYDVIPVLTTLPHNTYRDAEKQNEIIRRLAREYDIPLLDYWSVMETLPNRGLGEDYLHPSASPNPAIFEGENLQFGYTQRNLTAIQMLDALMNLVLH